MEIKTNVSYLPKVNNKKKIERILAIPLVNTKKTVCAIKSFLKDFLVDEHQIIPFAFETDKQL